MRWVLIFEVDEVCALRVARCYSHVHPDTNIVCTFRKRCPLDLLHADSVRCIPCDIHNLNDIFEFVPRLKYDMVILPRPTTPCIRQKLKTVQNVVHFVRTTLETNLLFLSTTAVVGRRKSASWGSFADEMSAYASRLPASLRYICEMEHVVKGSSNARILRLPPHIIHPKCEIANQFVSAHISYNYSPGNLHFVSVDDVAWNVLWVCDNFSRLPPILHMIGHRMSNEEFYTMLRGVTKKSILLRPTLFKKGTWFQSVTRYNLFPHALTSPLRTLWSEEKPSSPTNSTLHPLAEARSIS